MAMMVRSGRVTALVAASLALALSACGSKEEKPAESTTASEAEGPKSVEDLQAEAAKLDRPDPGKYKQTVEILQMEMPGLPKEAQAQMQTHMPKVQVNEICLTEKDTEAGYRDMFKDLGKGSECTYDRFDVSGGKLDAKLTCKSPEQGTAVMMLSGMTTKSGSDVTVAMESSGGATPMANVKMKMHMKTERIGDCVS